MTINRYDNRYNEKYRVPRHLITPVMAVAMTMSLSILSSCSGENGANKASRSNTTQTSRDSASGSGEGGVASVTISTDGDATAERTSATEDDSTGEGSPQYAPIPANSNDLGASPQGTRDQQNPPPSQTGGDGSTGDNAGNNNQTNTQNTSGGSGGAAGLQTVTASNNGKYMINAPANQTGALGLLVLLHGSNASNYENFVNRMNNVARQHGLIPVSVLAPNGKGWNEGNQTDAATYLDEIVQNDLLRRYNIDLNKIFFSGQSSGGGFLSSHFIPLKSEKYAGGAFMQCGAAPPRGNFNPTAEHKAKFKLHFEITTGDQIWPQYYARAVDFYTRAGMTLTSDDTKPGGHCQFSQEAVIANYIQGMLQR